MLGLIEKAMLVPVSGMWLASFLGYSTTLAILYPVRTMKVMCRSYR